MFHFILNFYKNNPRRCRWRGVYKALRPPIPTGKSKGRKKNTKGTTLSVSSPVWTGGVASNGARQDEARDERGFWRKALSAKTWKLPGNSFGAVVRHAFWQSSYTRDILLPAPKHNIQNPILSKSNSWLNLKSVLLYNSIY